MENRKKEWGNDESYDSIAIYNRANIVYEVGQRDRIISTKFYIS